MKKTARGILTALAMLVLILDTKTALVYGNEGVKLCISTLIPSLFPFFLVSNLLLSCLQGLQLGRIERLLRIPKGSGSAFLTGILGGYPVGAQSVAQLCRNGSISQTTARRMLTFCSNAGPSFLFGIGARLFPEMWMCWALWGIHIISAFLVSFLTPGKSDEVIFRSKAYNPTLPEALKKAIHTMAMVCGWVILFRVLLGFCQRWFLWLLPELAQIIFAGVLELAGGCCSLMDAESLGLRFILCSGFLAFGGLCVTLQTLSVAQDVDSSLYLPGKLTQAAISLLLCQPLQLFLDGTSRPLPLAVYAGAGVWIIFYGILQNKTGKKQLLPV